MAKQPKIRVCKNCNNPLPEKATVCPSCGAKNKKPIYKKWWFWLIIALIVIGAASSGGTESDPSDNQPSSSVSSGMQLLVVFLLAKRRMLPRTHLLKVVFPLMNQIQVPMRKQT